MPIISYQGNDFASREEESVLTCLTRNHIDYPYSCQSGVCQTCLIKATNSKEVESSWQKGLSPQLQQQGYFLACLAKPNHDIHIEAAQNDCNFKACITSIDYLTGDVIQLTLSCNDYQHLRPGQYINLINPQGHIRSYSIANHPFIEQKLCLHIRLYINGHMGQWLQQQAQVGQQIEYRGPAGQCFYANSEKRTYDILLAGTGTGLAPLHAIALDALSQNHQGTITLVHGAIDEESLYFCNELNDLDQQQNNFNYKPCVLKQAVANQAISCANINDHCLKQINDFKQTHVFLCGNAKGVHQLTQTLFLAGIPSANIASDSFLYRQ